MEINFFDNRKMLVGKHSNTNINLILKGLEDSTEGARRDVIFKIDKVLEEYLTKIRVIQQEYPVGNIVGDDYYYENIENYRGEIQKIANSLGVELIKS